MTVPGSPIDTELSAPRSGELRGVKYERRLVALLTLGNGIAALDAQAVFYLMPFIVSELHINNGQVGLIGTAVLVGWSISALIVGLTSDRVGRRKPFLIGAYLCFAAFSGLSAVTQSFALLLFARLLMGLAEGPIIPIQQAMVMAESAPQRRGLNMGLVQNLGSQIIGTLAAPIFLVWLAGQAGWRSSFLISAIPALLVAGLVWKTLREPPAAALEPQEKVDATRAIKAVFTNRNVRMCIAIATCCVAWYFLLLTFLPLSLLKGLNLTPAMMSFVMSLIGVSGALSSFVVPGLSDRLGRRTVIILFCLVGVLAPLGVVLLGTNPMFIGFAVLVGALMIGNLSLLMGTVPQESVSPAHRATATALVLCVSQLLGGMVGPALGGRLADQFGLMAPMILAAGLAALAGLIAIGLRETREPRVVR